MKHYITKLFMLKKDLFCAFMSYQGVLFYVDISAHFGFIQGDKQEYHFLACLLCGVYHAVKFLSANQTYYKVIQQQYPL